MKLKAFVEGIVKELVRQRAVQPMTIENYCYMCQIIYDKIKEIFPEDTHIEEEYWGEEQGIKWKRSKEGIAFSLRSENGHL